MPTDTELLQHAREILRKHYQWHLNQTKEVIIENDISIIPADEFADSALCEETEDVLDKLNERLSTKHLAFKMSEEDKQAIEQEKEEIRNKLMCNLTAPLPTVIKTDNDTYIIIGAIVQQADYEELKDRIGSDETAIEIDAEFLENAVFVESR